MYWDVVEVRAEPDYSLFVRFKDGLAGHVRLQREELTGALAPLRDAEFFGKAFIDGGAVAWSWRNRSRTRCDVCANR